MKIIIEFLLTLKTEKYHGIFTFFTNNEKSAKGVERFLTSNTILTYVEQLHTLLKKELKHHFVGMYIHGSLSLNDFQNVHSDLDLLVISSIEIVSSIRKRLIASINQYAFPCPVAGIDLTIIHQKTASNPSLDPKIELAIYTEKKQLHQIHSHFFDTDLLIDLSICRKFGKTIWGPPPQEIISPIPQKWILRSLRKSLEWREQNLLHPYHDPQGENAVLNACRAWRYKTDNIFCSKTEAGQWAYQREDQFQDLIRQALHIRHRPSTMEVLDQKHVLQFLKKTKYALGTTLVHRWIHWIRNHWTT